MTSMTAMPEYVLQIHARPCWPADKCSSCARVAPEAVAANLTRRAQAQGLLVTPYTFRNDDPWNATGLVVLHNY